MDYKHHEYEVRNLLPLFHLATTLRLARKSSVPLLIEGQRIVQDSSDIIDYLDQRFPHKPLTPRQQEEANHAREWERWLDEEVGVTLRQWFYFHTLPDTPHALHFLEQDAPAGRCRTFRRFFPLVRFAMQRKMHITPRSAGQALSRLERALDLLDAVVGKQPFLVGVAFSRADLTAAALLSPMLAGGRTDAELQHVYAPPVWAWWQSFRQRPVYTWMQDIYRTYR